MTIEVTVNPEHGTHTPEKSIYWNAACVVDGVEYTARSRMAVVQSLSRKLVAAGIDDAPLRVTHNAVSGKDIKPLVFLWQSFHREAQYTYGESAKMNLRRGKYVDPADRMLGTKAVQEEDEDK